MRLKPIDVLVFVLQVASNAQVHKHRVSSGPLEVNGGAALK